MGEQQVFWIAVVFSQEYCRGSLTHAVRLGYVGMTECERSERSRALAPVEARKAVTRPRADML